MTGAVELVSLGVVTFALVFAIDRAWHRWRAACRADDPWLIYPLHVPIQNDDGTVETHVIRDHAARHVDIIRPNTAHFYDQDEVD